MTEFSATATAKSTGPISQLLWFHQRFGKPQFYALLLLAAFAGQCFWLAARISITNSEIAYLSPAHAGELPVMGAEEPSSPVVKLLARASVMVAFPGTLDSPFWRMWLRAPFILIGCLLGASLWYVSRRLYGNVGGYVALCLYSFSPPMIQRWAAVEPDVLAAWGTFGCIFTGIAVAHTLYAPREVVLWNWRRILLLGVSIGVGIAAVPTASIAVPIALGFMLYLVPHRRGAAVGILCAACAVGAIVLAALFSFDVHAVASFLRTSDGFRFVATPLRAGVVGVLAKGFVFRNGPAVATLVAMTICVWLGWRRVRFFGTAAPLIVAAVFVLLGLFGAHRDVLVFLEIVLPFVFVFVAGVCADLFAVKSVYGGVVRALILATVLSNCLFSVLGLARI